MEALGGTANTFLLESTQKLKDFSSVGSYLIDSIFSIEDRAKEIFKTYDGPLDRLFTIETINYPEYRGYKLYHDPSLRTFHKHIEFPLSVTDLLTIGLIGGGIGLISVLTALFGYRHFKRRKE